MVAASDANPGTTILGPGYDPAGHQERVAVRVTNVQTDSSVTPNIVYGDVTLAQGGGGGQGTAWRVEGDSAELSGLSANSLNALLVPKTDVRLYKSFSLQVTGTWVATIDLQGSNDGTNFLSIPFEDGFGNAISSPSQITYTGILCGPCRYRYFQVQVTAYTSGTLTGVLELFTVPFVPSVLVSQEGKNFGRDPWTVATTNVYPNGATPLTNSSGNVANASAVATLAGVGGKTTYISGFQVSGSGATLGLPVTVTVAGLISGTNSYTYSAVAGVLLENQSLIVSFNPPIPASAVNTAIVVTCPALGAGNTNNVVNAQGFQL